jgi:hypothetical protein
MSHESFRSAVSHKGARRLVSTLIIGLAVVGLIPSTLALGAEWITSRTINVAPGTKTDPVGAGFDNIYKPGATLKITLKLMANGKDILGSSSIDEPAAGDPLENRPRLWVKDPQNSKGNWKTTGAGSDDTFWVVFKCGKTPSAYAAQVAASTGWVNTPTMGPNYGSVSDIDIDADTLNTSQAEFRAPSRTSQEDEAEFVKKGEESAQSDGIVGLRLYLGADNPPGTDNPGPWCEVALSLNAKTVGTLTLTFGNQLEMKIKDGAAITSGYTVPNNDNAATIPKDGTPKHTRFLVRAKAGATSPAPTGESVIIRAEFKDTGYEGATQGLALDVIRVTIMDKPWLELTPAPTYVMMGGDKKVMVVTLKPEDTPQGSAAATVRVTEGNGAEPPTPVMPSVKLDICNAAGVVQAAGNIDFAMDWSANQQKSFKIGPKAVGATHVLAVALTEPNDPAIRKTEVNAFVFSLEVRLPATAGLAGMRTDGATRFVYPSKWEEAHRTKLIEYKGDSGGANLPFLPEIVVMDGDETVWHVDVAAGVAWTNQWTDSGFVTRTNKGKDADGHANLDAHGAYKFIDPSGAGTKAFQTCAKAGTPSGDYSSQSLSFQARKRSVFYVEAAGSSFEAIGKVYMWKTYGLIVGGAAAVSDPANDANKLGFTTGARNFAGALECVTPRGSFDCVAHGLFGGIPASVLSAIRIDATDCYGFKGPASGKGTWNGQKAAYDLTDRMEAHNTFVDITACYSADTGPGAACSVIESFRNSLSGTIGGGGSVHGYTGVATLTAVFTIGQPTWNATGLTPAEKAEILGHALDNAQQQLKNGGVLDATGALTTNWIVNHSVTNVISAIPALNLAAMTTAAKNDFDAAHPGHAAYTFTVTTAPPLVLNLGAVTRTPAPTTVAVPGTQ